jgi:hypothetical protein
MSLKQHQRTGNTGHDFPTTREQIDKTQTQFSFPKTHVCSLVDGWFISRAIHDWFVHGKIAQRGIFPGFSV